MIQHFGFAVVIKVNRYNRAVSTHCYVDDGKHAGKQEGNVIESHNVTWIGTRTMAYVSWGEGTGNSQCMWAGLQEESMCVYTRKRGCIKQRSLTMGE